MVKRNKTYKLIGSKKQLKRKSSKKGDRSTGILRFIQMRDRNIFKTSDYICFKEFKVLIRLLLSFSFDFLIFFQTAFRV